MVALMLLIFIICAFNSVNCLQQDVISNTFGFYQAEWSNLQLCSGPKSRDLSKVDARIAKIENSFILHMNITFIENVHIDHVKVEVYTKKNHHKSMLFSKKIDDPCKHYALQEGLDKYFGVKKNCIATKGEKYFASNMTEMTYLFFGKSFYYGEYIVKAISFSDKGNLFCMQLNSLYKKL